ncbi:hypothetical protein [Streptococcus dysgalactiae]|nr:hypothetical protein [Streptococcus dysgalactiae]
MQDYYTPKGKQLTIHERQQTRRTHENFLFILLCPDINFEKIPF